MNYVYVEGGKIIEGPRGLPRSWRNISGLNLLNNDSLKSLGWLPVRLEEGTPDEKFLGSAFTIGENEVVETKQWRKHTAEEKQEIEVQKAKQVRSERNQKLKDSDWTQVLDAPLDSNGKNSWTVYRQALRDVPSQQGFPWTVVWPTEPNS